MVWEESKRLWGIGMPIAIATLSLFAVSSVTTIFVGHLGNLPLAAASIGLSVYSTFALGFLVRRCSSPFSTAYICMLTRARLLATERR
jgi:MATE family multidrug resistance protein